MTTEEKMALISLCRIEISRWDSVPDKSYMVELMNIALAAMTAQPVGKFIQWDSGDEETGPEIEWVEANTKQAIPLYKCAPVAVPEGWRLVPVEPTEEMLHASYKESAVYSPSAYRAMIAAAPTP